MTRLRKLLTLATLGSISGVISTVLMTRKHQTKLKLADSPAELSIKDWKRALIETKNALGNKNLPILAAGVTYFSTLAFFPLVAALVAIAGFVIASDQIHTVVNALNTYLPKDIASLLSTQLQNVSGKHPANIVVAIFAILLSIFSISGAIQNAMNATNVAYGTKETRKFFKLKLTSFVLTFGMIALSLLIIPLLLINRDFLLGLGVPSLLAHIFPYARWLLLIVLVTVALAVFYRYAPDRKEPKWQWVSWGAAVATVLWLLGTVLFFIYAQYFAGFSDTYSLFAGIIVLMTWLNLSAFIIILGAEINHRLETKTDAPTAAT